MGHQDSEQVATPTDFGAIISAVLKFRIDFLKQRDSGTPAVWDTRADGVLAITMTPAMRDAADRLRGLFETRFGRPMRPNDPIFFDPFSAEPMPFQGDHLAAALVKLAEEVGMSAAELFAKLDWLELLKVYDASKQ